MFENKQETEKVNRKWLEAQKNLQQAELVRRQKLYGIGETLPVGDKVVIVVDDGAATGLSLMASVRYIRSFKPEKIIVALPVAPGNFITGLNALVDEVICLAPDASFRGSVGAYYESFPQVSDAEVVSALASSS